MRRSRPTARTVAPALLAPFGEPWPAARPPSATDRRYTGQRSFESSLGSLYHYQARWYSPVLGRFLSPDPFVPEPGNPQALNRYSYVYNNPYVYVDPSGYDPLDQAWHDSFYRQYGRTAEWYDELIRLYSLSGFGDESWFYDEAGFVDLNYLEEAFVKPPAGRTWGRMPAVLDRLALHYERGESSQFARDVAALFAGLPTRSEASYLDALLAEAVHPWVYLAPDASLSAYWMGVRDDDANVHHWAAFLAGGYAVGVYSAIRVNFLLEVEEVFPEVWRIDRSDVIMGHSAAMMGDALRVGGVYEVGSLLRALVPIR